MTSLSTAFDPRNNAIGFLRWLMAFMVIFSHAGPIAGFYGGKDLGTQWSTEQSLGGVAVCGFLPGGRGVRAAHRVREHRQPAARAFCGKTTRDRDAVRARRARGALVRQLVSESMLLAMLGGGGGLLLAEWTLRALVAFGTDYSAPR